MKKITLPPFQIDEIDKKKKQLFHLLPCLLLPTSAHDFWQRFTYSWGLLKITVCIKGGALNSHQRPELRFVAIVTTGGRVKFVPAV